MALERNPKFIVTKGRCPTCGVPLERQLLRSMDFRTPFETQGSKPPEAEFAVGMFPYMCPQCGYQKYELAG